MLRELLTADVQRVESIRAVGTMLEQVFLRLRLFLHGLVLAEAVSTPFHSSGLYGQYQVIVILTVEERHQALLPSKALVDEQVLLIMAHRVAQVHILYLPPVPLEFMDDHIAEVLVVHGIVASQCRGVVIEHHRLVLVVGIVRAEVIHECGNLPFKLHIERLQDVQAVAARLTSYNSVNIGIVVHANANRGQRIHVLVGTGV